MRFRFSLLVLIALAAVAGCGGGGESRGTGTSVSQSTDSSAAESTPPEATDPVDGGGKTVIAALGDSITAGSPLWDPDPAVRAQIGPGLGEQSQFEFWAAKDDPTLDFDNCGVFGERTDEIAQRLDECADGADALIIQGGINDIAQGRPVTDAADDLESMVEHGQDLGIPVALVEVLPWNNGFPAAAKPIEQLNSLIAKIGKRHDVAVMPFYSTLEDPDRPGTMRDDLTIDGDHPSVAGYRLLAEKAFEVPR